ncbi:MAG: cation:proton antiporter, partial [Candidatus Margulisbacteria bacterium]|nr:cation:proton antiporter [Candidatus Margulisiibacteriota bacterium]
NLPLSLILGSLAAATAPGGTTTVIQEYQTRGPLTSTLFGVIGADDAIAILIFAVNYNISKVLLQQGASLQIYNLLGRVGLEIGGSIVVGIVLGLILSFILPRILDDDVKTILVIGAIFLCGGISQSFHMSMILTTMTMGIVISNIRPHRSRSYFVSINKFAPPIYILFFILVGAKLDVRLLPTMGLIGLIYIVCRIIGKTTGAWIGGTLSKAPVQVRKYLGFCLWSQAGVAIGLAMAAQQDLSAISEAGRQIGLTAINVITATTLIFQLIGPVAAKYGLQKAGEIRRIPDA